MVLVPRDWPHLSRHDTPCGEITRVLTPNSLWSRRSSVSWKRPRCRAGCETAGQGCVRRRDQRRGPPPRRLCNVHFTAYRPPGSLSLTARRQRSWISTGCGVSFHSTCAGKAAVCHAHRTLHTPAAALVSVWLFIYWGHTCSAMQHTSIAFVSVCLLCWAHTQCHSFFS